MFQLETTNIRFEHLVICSIDCWGQKSPKVIQGNLGSLSVNTVFCRIHAPARTTKSPEGRLYSGVIISKSNDVGRLRGFPNLQFRF